MSSPLDYGWGRSRPPVRRNEFSVRQISNVLGYKSHDTFLRAYKRWAGERPSEVGPRGDVPGIGYPTYRRALYGELDSKPALELMRRLGGLYPEAFSELVSEAGGDGGPLPRTVVDGGDYMKGRAEEIWREIRDLAPEEQRRRLRRYEFRSEALFDLLRETSRQEGRCDRQLGIHLAELALISLEGSADFFGDRIHDLRALGHACVGNAHRLARDFPAADQAFERAEAEWQVPRRAKVKQLSWIRFPRCCCETCETRSWKILWPASPHKRGPGSRPSGDARDRARQLRGGQEADGPGNRTPPAGDRSGARFGDGRDRVARR